MKFKRKTNVHFSLDDRCILDNKDVSVERDVSDKRDPKKFSCILYQDDLFFQYHLFEVLLIKDILTIKNEI